MRWQTRHDERDDKRFQQAGPTARLLYIDAGAWAMEQVFNTKLPLPETWFIPDRLVREWGKRKAASLLVREGLWERAERDGRAGYVYVDLAYENTPTYIARKREQYRREHERKTRRRG